MAEGLETRRHSAAGDYDHFDPGLRGHSASDRGHPLRVQHRGTAGEKTASEFEDDPARRGRWGVVRNPSREGMDPS